MLTKAPFWQKLKAEQPSSFLREDVLALVSQYFLLCVTAVTQESYYIHMLHLHETTKLSLETLLIQLNIIRQPLYSDYPILK